MLQQSNLAVELAAYVGLDWSDHRHAICLEAAEAGPVQRYEIEQQPEALHEWVSMIIRKCINLNSAGKWEHELRSSTSSSIKLSCKS